MNASPRIGPSLVLLAVLAACGREPKTVGAPKSPPGAAPGAAGKPGPAQGKAPAGPQALLAPLWKVPSQDVLDQRARKFIQAENADLVLQKLKEDLGVAK